MCNFVLATRRQGKQQGSLLQHYNRQSVSRKHRVSRDGFTLLVRTRCITFEYTTLWCRLQAMFPGCQDFIETRGISYHAVAYRRTKTSSHVKSSHLPSIRAACHPGASDGESLPASFQHRPKPKTATAGHDVERTVWQFALTTTRLGCVLS